LTVANNTRDTAELQPTHPHYKPTAADVANAAVAAVADATAAAAVRHQRPLPAVMANRRGKRPHGAPCRHASSGVQSFAAQFLVFPAPPGLTKGICFAHEYCICLEQYLYDCIVMFDDIIHY